MTRLIVYWIRIPDLYVAIVVEILLRVCKVREESSLLGLTSNMQMGRGSFQFDVPHQYIVLGKLALRCAICRAGCHVLCQ